MMRMHLAIFLLLSAVVPRPCTANHATTTSSGRWTCDHSSNWVQGVTYEQTVINSRFTAGVTHYNDALDQCKRLCEDRVSCMGFFYQQHHNTHQICGFYSSSIASLSFASHGHLEGAVCTNSSPRTKDDPPVVPLTILPRCTFNDVATTECECHPDDFFTRHSEYGYAPPARCIAGMVCSNTTANANTTPHSNTAQWQCNFPYYDGMPQWNERCSDFFAAGTSAFALKSILMSPPCYSTGPAVAETTCGNLTCDSSQEELLALARRAGLVSCPLVRDLTTRRSMKCLQNMDTGISCGGLESVHARMQNIVQRFSNGVPSFMAAEHRSRCADPCLQEGKHLAYALLGNSNTASPATMGTSLLHAVERICMTSSNGGSEMCFPVFADFMSRFNNTSYFDSNNNSSSSNNNSSSSNNNNNNNDMPLTPAYLEQVCSRPDACVQNVLVSSFDNENDEGFPLSERESIAELMCLRNNDKSCLLELSATDNPLDNACGRCLFSGHLTTVTHRQQCMELNNVQNHNHYSTDPLNDPFFGAGHWVADVHSGQTMLTGHWVPPPLIPGSSNVTYNTFQWQQLDGANEQCNEQLQGYAMLGCCIESILQSAVVPTEAEAILIRSLFNSAIPPVPMPVACSMNHILVPAQIEIPHLQRAECDVLLDNIKEDIAATAGISTEHVIDAACSAPNNSSSSSRSQNRKRMLQADNNNDDASIVNFNLAVPDKNSGDRVSAAIVSPTLKKTEAAAAQNGIQISGATGTAFEEVVNPYSTGTAVYNHSDHKPILVSDPDGCDPSLYFDCIEAWVKEGDNIYIAIGATVALTFAVTALCTIRYMRSRSGKHSGAKVVKGSAIAGALPKVPVTFVVSNASPAVLSGQGAALV